MGIQFPAAPLHGAQYTPPGIPVTWQYDSGRNAWRVLRGGTPWTDIVGKPSTFPPSPHEHPIDEVTGLQAVLDVKQDISARGQINGYAPLNENGKVPENMLEFGAISWDNIPDKPAEFPPSTHTHPVVQISDSGSTGQQLVRAGTQSDARSIIGAIGPDDNARVSVDKNSAIIGVRRGLNFKEGSNITLSVVDDPAEEEVEITINAAGGAAGAARYFVSEIKPAAPFVNDIWFDAATGLIFTYYDDGTTTQWIESIPFLANMPTVFTKFTFPPAPVDGATYNPIPGATWKWSAARGVWFAVTTVSDSYTKLESDSHFVDIGGDVMTGPLGVVHPPTANVHAASKQYVDGQDSLKVAKAGDSMSGLLTLSADPSNALHAATKQYADARGAAAAAFTPSGNIAANTVQGAIAELDTEKVAKAGDTMTGNLTINKGVAGGIGPKLEFYNSGGSLADAAVIDFYDASIRSRLQFSVDRSPYGADLVFLSGDGTPVEKFRVQTDGQVLVTADPIGALNVATKQYVDTRVRYDAAQSLTAAQQQQARQNIFAAPFDALAYNGMQINGGMEVSQERAANGTNVSDSYVCDGWKLHFVGTMAVSATAVASADFPNFPSLLYIVPITAQASLGDSDLVCIQQLVEGLRLARLGWGTANAQPVTLGFWSKHHRTGVYGGSVRNGALNRSYAFSYTQAVADTPQYNTVTIPGDTTGTWASNNTAGLAVVLTMACGNTYIAPVANTWSGGSYLSAPGQINGVAATSDVFRVTGVVILPGNEAPSAARSPFIMRPYDQELVVCKRYYRKIEGSTTPIIGGYGVTASSVIDITIPLIPEMRATPTVTEHGIWSKTNVLTTQFFASPTTLGWQVLATAAGGVQAFGNPGGFTFDARL